MRVLYASKVNEGLRDVLFLERIVDLLPAGSVRMFATGTKSNEVVGRDEMEKRGVKVLSRRFTVDDVREATGDEHGDVVVYVCGPPVMTDRMVEALTDEGGLERKRVMMEKWW